MWRGGVRLGGSPEGKRTFDSTSPCNNRKWMYFVISDDTGFNDWQVAEYEGCERGDVLIQNFWTVLFELPKKDKLKFLCKFMSFIYKAVINLLSFPNMLVKKI